MDQLLLREHQCQHLGTAAKTGYLVTFGPLRAGPISGFDYSHVMINSYTESGDALVTMIVNRQNLDNLTGNAGFQLRYPFSLGVLPCSPFSTSPPSMIFSAPAAPSRRRK